MANKTWAGVVLLVLAQGLAGCDSALPTGPSNGPPNGPTNGDGQIRGLVKDTAFRPLAGAVVEVIAGYEYRDVDNHRRRGSILVVRCL